MKDLKTHKSVLKSPQLPYLLIFNRLFRGWACAILIQASPLFEGEFVTHKNIVSSPTPAGSKPAGGVFSYKLKSMGMICRTG
jgi:hypothetical protein